MEWEDEGVVLRAKRHGENDLVAVLLTFEHGRHAGLVRGGASRKQWPIWQNGNRLEISWRARIADQLGQFRGELLEPHAARMMQDPLKLAAMTSACAISDTILPERQPFAKIYAALVHILRCLDTPDWQGDYVRFELLLLQNAGFGLRLDACAVTGSRDNLTHVSPRTGRAVCAAAAEPYLDKLLPLPAFLQGSHAATPKEIAQGLRLAGYFFARHVYGPADRAIPLARDRLAAMLSGLDDDHEGTASA